MSSTWRHASASLVLSVLSASVQHHGKWNQSLSEPESAALGLFLEVGAANGGGPTEEVDGADDGITAIGTLDRGVSGANVVSGDDAIDVSNPEKTIGSSAAQKSGDNLAIGGSLAGSWLTKRPIRRSSTEKHQKGKCRNRRLSAQSGPVQAV